MRTCGIEDQTLQVEPWVSTAGLGSPMEGARPACAADQPACRRAGRRLHVRKPAAPTGAHG